MPNDFLKNKKIALAHDFLVRIGGAERVLKALSELFPDAPIYTLFYDEKIKDYFPGIELRPSFLQKMPYFLRRRYRSLLPLMPIAAESFDFRDFDIIISSSSSFFKGIIARPRTIHICYMHTPTRYLWDYTHHYLPFSLSPFYIFKKILLHYLRIWDRQASERPDFLIANSLETSCRIKKFYRRRPRVVYPPVAISAPILGDLLQLPDKYFLLVSYLSLPKKADLAIVAFNKLELPLVIAGSGPCEKKLKKMAKSNIIFLGEVNDSQLSYLYQKAEALIMPQEEDFGITAVEAQLAGTPVLAFRGGGALETVKEGITGEFFDDQIPEVLADGVRRLRENIGFYNKEEIKKWARKFSKQEFKNKIIAELNLILNVFD